MIRVYMLSLGHQCVVGGAEGQRKGTHWFFLGASWNTALKKGLFMLRLE